MLDAEFTVGTLLKYVFPLNEESLPTIKFLFKDASVNPIIFVVNNNTEFILIPEIFASENIKSLHLILLVTVRLLLNETSPDTQSRLFKETSYLLLLLVIILLAVINGIRDIDFDKDETDVDTVVDKDDTTVDVLVDKDETNVDTPVDNDETDVDVPLDKDVIDLDNDEIDDVIIGVVIDENE